MGRVQGEGNPKPPVLELGCHVDPVLTDWAKLWRASGASSAGTGNFLMRQLREDFNGARWILDGDW